MKLHHHLPRLAAACAASAWLFALPAHAVEDTTQPEPPPAAAAASDASAADMSHLSGMPATAHDHATVRAVRRALARTSGLDSSHIIVTSRRHIVLLTGFCTSDHQVALAVRSARRAAGGSVVKNDLSLDSPR